jgi:Predicted RNA-binding protein
VYIGEGERDDIDHIKRRISYDDLTNSSQMELIGVIEEIVKEKEQEFVEFFNKSDSITSRFHHLEIIPGIGKKLMWDIIDERRRSPFKSFEDIEKRIKTLYHPEKLIAKRIEEEIKDKNIKYRTFSKGPSDGVLKRI